MLQLLLSQSVFLHGRLILRVDLADRGLGLDQEALQLLLIVDKLLNLELSGVQGLPDMHQVDAVDALVHDGLAHFTEAQRASRFHIETDHGDVIHVVDQGGVEIGFTPASAHDDAPLQIRICRRCRLLLLHRGNVGLVV